VAVRRLSTLTADKLANARRDASRLPCFAEVSDRVPLMMEHQFRKHDVAGSCRYWPSGLSTCHEFRQLAFELGHAPQIQAPERFHKALLEGLQASSTYQ